MPFSEKLRGALPTLSAAVPMIIIPIAVLPVTLTAAERLDLSEAETISWIMVAYGLPSVVGLVLATLYRRPLLLTGNIFALTLVGSLAGEPRIRHRAAIIAAVGGVVVALLAGIAADLPELVPLTLLLALAGLALFGVLARTLRRIFRGPLVLGPLFAFAIAMSDISLLALGPFFWALVVGTAVSLALEREAWRELGEGGAA